MPFSRHKGRPRSPFQKAGTLRGLHPPRKLVRRIAPEGGAGEDTFPFSGEGAVSRRVLLARAGRIEGRVRVPRETLGEPWNHHRPCPARGDGQAHFQRQARRRGRHARRRDVGAEPPAPAAGHPVLSRKAGFAQRRPGFGVSRQDRSHAPRRGRAFDGSDDGIGMRGPPAAGPGRRGEGLFRSAHHGPASR